MGGNAGRLKFLYLGSERKVQCYNEFFINEHVFYTKEYSEGRKTYNIGFCTKGSMASYYMLLSCDIIVRKMH
jgi:hypothetical protein